MGSYGNYRKAAVLIDKSAKNRCNIELEAVEMAKWTGDEEFIKEIYEKTGAYAHGAVYFITKNGYRDYALDLALKYNEDLIRNPVRFFAPEMIDGWTEFVAEIAEKSGDYYLASRIYSSFGKQEKVERIRKKILGEKVEDIDEKIHTDEEIIF